MANTQIQTEQCLFVPSALIELWTLNGVSIGLDTIYYFVDGSNTSYNPVVFNGISYVPFPIQVQGMALDGKGSIPRPKLSVSNINGFVSSLLLQNGQLNGATLTRQRVYARFIDAVNFPVPKPTWVTPDPTSAYAPEPWTINRKIVENQQIVQFELISALELQNAKLPIQQIIANVCSWKYRSAQCGFSGAPVADSSNRTFIGYYGLTLVNKGVYNSSTSYNAGDYVVIYSTLPQFSSIPVLYVCVANGTTGINPIANPGKWVADACAKTLAACALRFPGQPLRTSAYPGVTRAGWISRA